MDRRQLVKFASLSAIPGWISSLTGCGGNSAQSPPPAPAPAPASVSYGAALLSQDELDRLPRTLSPLGAESAAQSLPVAFDNRSGGNLPSAGHQGDMPSCTAWAVGYAVASFFKAKGSNLKPDEASRQASPADLYAKLLNVRSFPCAKGTYIGDALNILLTEGVASLAQLPYSDRVCVAPTSVRDFQLTGFQHIATTDSVSIKRELANGKVLPFGALVYDELQYWGVGPDKGGVYRVARRSGGGGHAMVIIGYDDDRNAWLVQNSWGAEFGDRGCFWYDYGSFLETANQVYSVNAAAPSPPSPPPPPSPSPSPSPPPAPANVIFTQLNPTTYVDPFYNLSVLNIYFTLSEPFFVETAEVLEQGPFGSLTIGPVVINQWALQSFFQWVVSLPQSFPPGQYTLVFTGVTQSGVRQQVRGTRSMALADETRHALSARSAEHHDLRQFHPRFLRLGDRL